VEIRNEDADVKRAALALVCAFVVLVFTQPRTLAQEPQLLPGVGVAGDIRSSLLSIAASSEETRRVIPLMDQWLTDGTLARRVAYDDPDVPGRRHEVFVQYHDGIPVYGGDVTRQTERGVTLSIFGTVYSDINVDVSPRLTSEEAIEALGRASQSTRVTAAAPSLMILPTLDGTYELTYSAPMLDGRTYFVSAKDGQLVQRVNNIKYQSAVGSGRGVLGDLKKVSATQSGGAFRTRDSLRPATILTLDSRSSIATFTRLANGGRWVDADLAADADNNWTDPAIVDAHAYMGWVYDYYYRTHRYQGLDNRNSPMIGVVANSTTLPDNAAFVPPPYGPDGTGGMFFGESSTGYPMTALDAVAHELTHGVITFALAQRTGRSLGLSTPLEFGPSAVIVGGRSFSCTTTTYLGVPFFCNNGRFVIVSDHAGALNEGLADIFGTAVEFVYETPGSGPQRADYLIGEDIPRPGGFSAPIRSLDNPGSLPVELSTRFRYPDNYARRLEFALVVSNGRLLVSPLAIVGGEGEILAADDDLGVHWNSTVISHAFYLAIQGGQNRTSGRTVQGVGVNNRSQIEQVFFRAIRDLIPSGVTFPQMAAALRQAANDLYGASGAPTRAVDQALTAVGL